MISEREKGEQERIAIWRASRRKTFLKGIMPFARNPIVHAAFERVDHYDFVPTGQEYLAYSVRGIIPLGQESSISMPSLTAVMIDNLDLTGSERVLEIGTASGYSAALLSCCAKEVFTVEYNERLVLSAQERLRNLGYNNIEVYVGDGALGRPEKAPFDAILVTAGARRIPRALRDQLAEGGRIVLPVGSDRRNLWLIKAEKREGRLTNVRVIERKIMFYTLVSNAHGGWTNDQLNPPAGPRTKPIEPPTIKSFEETSVMGALISLEEWVKLADQRNLNPEQRAYLDRVKAHLELARSL